MTIERLRRSLHHPDPPQLWYQLNEIVEGGIYLKHGIRVRPGDTVLDVGANVGVAAAFFAEECGAGTVHSFEPVPPIFEVLLENLRPFPACVPHAYGLGSESGRASITYYPNDWAISGLYADPETERGMVKRAMLNLGASEAETEDRLHESRFDTETLDCELKTLSEALESESIEQVDLLKIDVEKAELDVLAGVGDADWPRIRQVVIELHLDEARRDQVAMVVRERGFQVTVAEDPVMAGTPIRMLYAVRD